MISYLQAIILGFLQGVTELFPISSLGHSVILPKLLGWNIGQNDNFFLSFLVATHFATAAVLFVVFFKDWKRIISGILRSLKEREIKATDSDAKLAWLLIVGTIPAGIIGLLFQDQVRSIFVSSKSAALFLFFNGFLLLGAELLRRRAKKSAPTVEQRISKLSWKQSLSVGAMQAIALIPGFSRTGATLAGGLLVGLNHEDAARYSFLLATPIIGAAAVLKLPDLFVANSSQAILGPSFVGAICAGIAAYFSVKFLTKYFKTETLLPFSFYCIIIGVVCSAILFLK